jgi:hypothetical protein
MKIWQNILCFTHKLEGGGQICCRSHLQMGCSLEGCECIVQGSTKCGWRSTKVHWDNVLFCVGRQPLATSLDALYLKNSPRWPLLAHYNGFHHVGYKRRPHPPPHCNDRHEQVRFILKHYGFQSSSSFLLSIYFFLISCFMPWNRSSRSILFQPLGSIEFDHIKPSLVNDFFYIHNINMIPLIRFKDVINLDVYKRCEIKSRKIWYFLMQESFFYYMYKV